MTAPAVAMTAEEYHANPALSSGTVRTLLRRSPAHALWERQHPIEPTPQMQLGTAFHTEVLGVGQAYEVCQYEDRRTKAAQDEVAKFRALGMIPLRPSENTQLHCMAEAVREHPLAGPLLADGEAERMVFWEDEKTGVQCRAMLDFLPANGRSIVDLKSTGDLSPASVGKLFASHGYPMQAAWYRRAAIAAGIGDLPFVFVLVDRDPPHPVVVATVDPDDLAWAGEQCDRACEIWRDCTASGLWPGYPTEPISVRMPGWARRDYDTLEETW